MATFTKFDPNAFLESAGCGGGSAKGPQNDRTLATVPGTPAQIQAPRFALGVANGRSGGWSDNCDERTAFEGGAAQAWAEALARPAHPPRDVPRQRWVQFIDDRGQFLDSGWAQRAPYCQYHDPDSSRRLGGKLVTVCNIVGYRQQAHTVNYTVTLIRLPSIVGDRF
jgi:hypothetical protein